MLELKILKDLAGENVARFYGACTPLAGERIGDGLSANDNSNFAVMEYGSKGTLEDVIANDSIHLDTAFQVSLLRDIASVHFRSVAEGAGDMAPIQYLELVPSRGGIGKL